MALPPCDRGHRLLCLYLQGYYQNMNYMCHESKLFINFINNL